MRILLCSYPFAPSIGGIETCSRILAQEFMRLGAKVTVLTATRSALPDTDGGLRVVRCPTPYQLFQLTREHDLVFQNNISLRLGWAAFLLRKPVAITVTDWSCTRERQFSLANRAKGWLLRRSMAIFLCQSAAQGYAGRFTVIPNPYDDQLFVEDRAREKTGELIFLGRLVSIKGLDLLLQSLALIKSQGVIAKLTVVGTGPERESLEALAVSLGIAEQVSWLGERTGRELVGILNEQRVLVVPSRWDEPFGIVALEGIACGLVVLGSEGGGLSEVIGPCGLTFANNDASDLAAKLRYLLSTPGRLQDYRQAAAEHLAQFQPRVVAQRYLAVFEEIM